MSTSTDPVAQDHILEPIEQAVEMYDNLLKDLHQFLKEHKSESDDLSTTNLPTVTIGDNDQNILQGPAGRPFINLAHRPGPDSLETFVNIIAKIHEQSLSTTNAMLAHTIFKISKRPVTRSTNPSMMPNATTAEIFATICPRLELGNQFHNAFKRVGKTTLEGLQRMDELNGEWQKLWDDELKRFEPATVWVTTKHIKMALQNLDGAMKGVLLQILAYQITIGW